MNEYLKPTALVDHSERESWSQRVGPLSKIANLLNEYGIDVATVLDKVGLPAADIPKFMCRSKQFNRVSTLIVKKGKPVFLLDDPDGTTWIVKAYSTNVDSSLDYEGMATLDTRFKNLPEGWKFRSLIIGQDLVIKANGAQRVMWDEFGNAYDALEPGFVNFKP